MSGHVFLVIIFMFVLCARHAAKFERTLNIPVVKEYASDQVQWYGTRKHCTQGSKEAGKRRIMAARFSLGKQPEFPVHCNWTRRSSTNLMFYVLTSGDVLNAHCMFIIISN